MSTKLLRIDRQGHRVDGGPGNLVAVRMAQEVARNAILSQTALTDSSGGAAANPESIVKLALLIGASASGSNLADKAASESALTTVFNALATLAAKARALALLTGAPFVPFDGGATVSTTTISAVTQTVAGNTTGVPVAAANAVFAAINTAFAGITGNINAVAVATSASLVTIPFNLPYTTTTPGAVLSNATGTAVAAAATLATDFSANLVIAANNVATLAAKLAELVTTMDTITDSSGGTASIPGVMTAVGAFPADTNVSASLGSTKATLDAAITAIKNGLAELFVAANQGVFQLDSTAVVYAGGGTASTTLASVGNSGTAAGTGTTKATMDATGANIDRAFLALAVSLNSASLAMNLPLLTLPTGVTGTPAVIGDSGTFNATGQLKTTVDAALVTWTNNLATAAARLAEIKARIDGPIVVVSSR